MNKITFFHCADLHLDTPFSTLSSHPGLPRMRRKAIFSNLLRIIDAAKKQVPNFLFISGDFFEHEYTPLKTIFAVNSAFCEIPETTIVMIAGNHDPEAANSFYRTYEWNDNVFFLSENNNNVFFADKNVEIFGLGWGPGYGQHTALKNLVLSKNRISILLFHGDIDLQIGNRDYNSVSLDLLNSKGFDYIAAGHNHKKKEGYGGSNIYIPGSLEPLGFDEPGFHGYFSGEFSSDSSLNVLFVKNTETEYKTIRIDISGFSSDEQTLASIESLTQKDTVLYKIILFGNKQLDYNPDSSILEKTLSEKALFIKVIDTSGFALSIESLSMIKGLKGTFTRLITKKMITAGKAERVLLEKALYYGIEAIETGKIESAGGEHL